MIVNNLKEKYATLGSRVSPRQATVNNEMRPLRKRYAKKQFNNKCDISTSAC